MVKMNMVYEGQLRCALTHGPSGDVIHTDAPKDNMGKGEAFSPTDLVAAALGSCMLTVMGIVAARHNIELKGTEVQVSKEMVTQPMRRIGTISLVFQMAAGIPPEKRAMLEAAAHSCPVHKSLHPDVQTPVQFIYA
ncbi:MAG: OsmC family protein [Candidatus Omnitrophica bacterium]|nr:OsmC family protein [Candidatus Omnitrophota bacterium]MDE2009204.1 OsmC family protein [Candidatus Omnitrophota bacterium]MDE2213725.1 OsmC family protein [Candidatus Omnitrophota bacterium]MDE2230700.1 OsmC family protein [Candidatus Omnitrophota bacterium]